MRREYNNEVVKGFIVFEGIDGSGTTTQAHALKSLVEEQGYEPRTDSHYDSHYGGPHTDSHYDSHSGGPHTDSHAGNKRQREQKLRSCELTCEPSDSLIGRAVREVLRKNETVAPGTLAKLFAADRHNHLYHEDDGIIAKTEEGSVVISDRYLFSSLAYQSVEQPFDEVWDLNCLFPLPEHLVFLDVSPDEGNRRLDKRGNPREVYEETELQQEIRENYFHVFSLYQNSAMHIHIFDGTLDREELTKLIWNKLDYR